MTTSPGSGNGNQLTMRSLGSKLSRAKEESQRLLANFFAWKTKRKIVVFESDDWGGMRMPNPDTLQTLLKAGLTVDRVSFNRLDGLEKREDIDHLINVISEHKDAHGHHPKFTCNMVLGNPDFEAIEQRGFSKFVWESMFDSYLRYYEQDLEPLWQHAIRHGFLTPQFHCREHLNSLMWIRDLQAGQPETRLCFQHRFFGQRTKTSSKVQKHYLAAYSAENLEELAQIRQIMIHGLDLFESMFGFRSRTFVACNYVLPQELEESLHTAGVVGIQTRIKQTIPVLARNGERIHITRYTGQRNLWGQRFTIRNVLFEPYQPRIFDWVGESLKNIQRAFFFRTPAIVSSHRINFSSAMDQTHRDRSLRALDRLLKSIIEQWPDVEFMTSDELITLMDSP